ncbi:MAG: hypothetical protein HY721_04730, partial [Planctomycetes bacterium]|nr:hypothetical protein [Planctomycetota bacterium]
MRSPPRRRPILVTLGLGLAAGLLAGCRTTDPLLLAEGGVHFRDLEAAAYRIAVAPFEVDPSLEPASLGAAAPERLHEALAAALADVEAGSDIVPLSTRSSFDAYAAKADILVLPRLEQASFGPAPDSGKVLVSSLLWLTTWIGSLWVEDRSYETGVVVSYDLVDPHTGAPVAGGIKARSGQVGLTFWERDHAFSRGFFLSMLVP